MKYRKHYLLVLLFFLITILSIQAQQDAQYSMYMFNPLAINPAYAGSRDAFSAVALYRNQWLGINGAPKTINLSVHSLLKSKNVGLGLNVVNDQIGTLKNTGIYGDFMYRIQLNRKKDWLAFGVKAGLDMFRANYNSLIATDITDNLYTTPIATNLFNVGTGIFYYGKKHYLGVSVPKLINNKLGVGQAVQKQHIFVMAGYVFPLNSVVDFKPSVVLKLAPNAPISSDANISFLFYKRLWLGAMYRYKESAGLNLVFNINEQVRFGYAYDYNLSKLTNYTSGSHEVMLTYDFVKHKKGFYSPRYF